MTRVCTFHRYLLSGAARITMTVLLVLSLIAGGIIGCVSNQGMLLNLNPEVVTDTTDGDDVNGESIPTTDGTDRNKLIVLDGITLTVSELDTLLSDPPSITEKEAMEIAVSDLDPRFYQATSTIYGPMVWDDRVITSYEVTVMAEDHVLLRYVDAEAGVMLYDERIEMSGDDPEDSDARAYYTSCPGGWPLCIQNPSTITFYSQNDPNWSWQVLGNGPSNYTVGNSGCLISSYGMALRQRGHGNTTPAVLNTKKQCFSGPNVVSGCMASQFGSSYAVIGVNQVWSHIAAGIPVTAYGYSTCKGSYHAQMIWGHDGARYWTKDPWYNWTNQDHPLCVNNPSYRVMY